MSIATLKTALTIRGSCYTTNWAFNILVPVAIYQLTGSLAVAGFFFLIENTFKFLAYLYGGSCMKLCPAASTHKYAEWGRWLAVPLFALVYWLHGPWWGIAIASILNQLANAVNNLLYEPRVLQWGDGSSTAYAHQLKIDLFSSILTTLCTLILPVYGILAMCFAAQNFGLYTLRRYQFALYARDFEQEATRPAISLKSWALTESVRPVKAALGLSRQLWGVMFLTMALMWPLAVICGNIPFFLEDGLGHAVTKDEVAWFFLAVSLAGFGVLHWNVKQANKVNSWVHKYGVSLWVLLLVITLGLISVTHSWLFIAILLFYNSLVYLLIPTVRALRQSYIPNNENSTSTTGLMIALDSIQYIVAGAVLSVGISVSQAYVACYIGCAVFLLLAMWLLNVNKYFTTINIPFMKRDDQ